MEKERLITNILNTLRGKDVELDGRAEAIASEAYDNGSLSYLENQRDSNRDAYINYYIVASLAKVYGFEVED